MRSLCKSFILLLLISLAAGSQAFSSTVIPVQAPRAMVVSVHELASRAGVEIDEGWRQCGGRRRGGRICVWRWCIRRREIWAAAASCSSAGGRRDHFIDYREKAPAAATANMYLDAKGNVIPDASTVGYKVHRRAGIGGRHGVRRKEVRQAVAEAGDGAGHQAGARRICAGSLATPEICKMDKRLAKFPSRSAYLPARWQLLQDRRSVQAAGTGAHSGAHRRQS